jgi:hypothetical protein
VHCTASIEEKKGDLVPHLSVLALGVDVGLGNGGEVQVGVRLGTSNEGTPQWRCSRRAVGVAKSDDGRGRQQTVVVLSLCGRRRKRCRWRGLGRLADETAGTSTGGIHSITTGRCTREECLPDSTAQAPAPHSSNQPRAPNDAVATVPNEARHNRGGQGCVVHATAPRPHEEGRPTLEHGHRARRERETRLASAYRGRIARARCEVFVR